MMVPRSGGSTAFIVNIQCKDQDEQAFFHGGQIYNAYLACLLDRLGQDGETLFLASMQILVQKHLIWSLDCIAYKFSLLIQNLLYKLVKIVSKLNHRTCKLICGHTCQSDTRDFLVDRIWSAGYMLSIPALVQWWMVPTLMSINAVKINDECILYFS